VDSDEHLFPDTNEIRKQGQEALVLGHLTVRTREAHPMFGRVFIASPARSLTHERNARGWRTVGAGWRAEHRSTVS
jgi:hypothetical protein